MHALRLVAFSIIALVWAAPAWAASDDAERRLRPGDRVAITLPTHDGFEEAETLVELDGHVSISTYGRVDIGGRTAKQATLRVRIALEDEIKLVEAINVRLIEPGMSVLVTGFVARPGVYRLTHDAAPWTAIQAAGGLADGADLTRAEIRRGAESLPLDLHASITGTGVEKPGLEAGDTLFVPAAEGQSSIKTDGRALMAHPAARDKYFVLGAVASPGVYPALADIDIVRALALAGGADQGADTASIRIIDESGARTVNLQTALEHAHAGGQLAPGTIVYVPKPASGQAYSHSDRLAVLGQVSRPGMFLTDRPLTLDRALALAGGPTDKAALQHVRIVRRSNGVITSQRVNLRRAIARAGLALNIRVGPGDMVLIGAVKDSPWDKAVDVASDLTVLAAAFSLLATL
jgi:protein involved in polysaccharide export with SLBB domain